MKITLSKAQWQMIGQKTGWIKQHAGFEKTFDSYSKPLISFLDSIIKSSGGYFVSTEEKQKYEKLKNIIVEVQDSDPIVSCSVEKKGDMDVVKATIGYSLSGQLATSDYGAEFSKQVGNVLNIYEIDEKGIKSHQTVGKNGAGKLKEVFIRDESYFPKLLEDFKETIDIGQTKSDTLVFKRNGTTKFGSPYYVFEKNNESYMFFVGNKNNKKTDRSIPGKILQVINEARGNLSETNNFEVDVSFIVKDKKIYQDKMSYTIDILDIKESELSKNKRKKVFLFNDQLSIFYGLREDSPAKMKQLSEKHLSQNSTTSFAEATKDLDELYESVHGHSLFTRKI